MLKITVLTELNRIPQIQLRESKNKLTSKMTHHCLVGNILSLQKRKRKEIWLLVRESRIYHILSPRIQNHFLNSVQSLYVCTCFVDNLSLEEGHLLACIGNGNRSYGLWMILWNCLSLLNRAGDIKLDTQILEVVNRWSGRAVIILMTAASNIWNDHKSLEFVEGDWEIFLVCFWRHSQCHSGFINGGTCGTIWTTEINHGWLLAGQAPYPTALSLQTPDFVLFYKNHLNTLALIPLR